MQDYQTQPYVSHTLQFILENVSRNIDLSSLYKQAPKFAHHETIKEIQGKFDVYFTSYQHNQNIKEEEIHLIPHIAKDNLMPKDLDSMQLPYQSASVSIQRSSALKKMSTSSKRQNLSLTEKLKKTSILAKSIKQSETIQKQNKSFCEQLQKQQIKQDPQVDHLRVLTQKRLKQEGEDKKYILMRQKRFQQKLQQMNKLQINNGTITQDYQGEHMVGAIQDEKIKHYAMKIGIGGHKKKLQDLNFEPILAKVQTYRYSKQKDNLRQIQSMELPLFPQAKYQPHKNHFNYKLDEYKKRYARGFSRFDKVSQTIDYNINQKQTTQDHFNQKKHLKDTLQLNNSQITRNSRVIRRLALPKLHGNYKVLDRYLDV